MRNLLRMITLIVPLLLGACGTVSVVHPTMLGLKELPDGRFAGGVGWRNSGWTMSSEASVIFLCDHEKTSCPVISAGTMAGAGHEAMIGALIQGAMGAATGALLLPKPAGVSFSPQTYVLQNMGSKN